MTQALELAKQGDPKAVAALMSKHLTPQGIAVKVATHKQTLQVLLDGIDVPNQAQMSGFVSKGIGNLAIPEIAVLEIFGKRTGQDEIDWVSAFSNATGSWETTDPDPATIFGEGNITLLCQQGDIDAIGRFTSAAVEDLISQIDRADIDEEKPTGVAAFVDLDEAGLLTVTIETQQFLDGPSFAADLGSRLNTIASPRIVEVALYKRKTPTAQPFLIKQMTLVPQR
ncbi:hypothetical protein IQ266_08175 [filamentous cyanobacterium LEGE 11480]|uniref:Uncharacterized protein n=1 Tax=Romeriopsis navalis LEGE 11480 TaxID=2777977 RepID=A0A928Z3W6_9CYAN|nr:hypothetical protein [Romeriopsis navalis]MBE9029705.1 hypothetical protein [Romeriopsis navalis LEGE 11480]